MELIVFHWKKIIKFSFIDMVGSSQFWYAQPLVILNSSSKFPVIKLASHWTEKPLKIDWDSCHKF